MSWASLHADVFVPGRVCTVEERPFKG